MKPEHQLELIHIIHDTQAYVPGQGDKFFDFIHNHLPDLTQQEIYVLSGLAAAYNAYSSLRIDKLQFLRAKQHFLSPLGGASPKSH